ncbi:MAG: hypothetical protein COV52_03860 [Gammaproteobacteria bacterium CG11_big_fil_rev_8_21_14_0_20_46_22]|nr:MAG: hypothetical protein COW05_01910 [Gammaproteobacteria bacterium CG12_big_fil_rev_8_21_14_0_65_46_12]PIR11456.1 MAG: hypothetical protein COV52_03860 [Gammaproteobacteria bacterium CG11_big_fil_rev_8_21_14_0_20_46_22]
MRKFWTWALFLFSAFFFVMATYYLVLLIKLPHQLAIYLLYRVVAGYFLAFVLFIIGARTRKRKQRRIFK